MLSTVDLPAPFGPIRQRSSPWCSARSTPRTARRPPKDLTRSFTSRIGGSAVISAPALVPTHGQLVGEPAEQHGGEKDGRETAPAAHGDPDHRQSRAG